MYAIVSDEGITSTTLVYMVIKILRNGLQGRRLPYSDKVLLSAHSLAWHAFREKPTTNKSIFTLAIF